MFTTKCRGPIVLARPWLPLTLFKNIIQPQTSYNPISVRPHLPITLHLVQAYSATQINKGAASSVHCIGLFFSICTIC